ADAPGAAEPLGPVDFALPRLLARGRANAAYRLRAIVRASVQPHLDRLPRHPRRGDAPGRVRLFREQPARDLYELGMVQRQSNALAGVFEGPVGSDGLRRPG